ncbi:MAG: hypothetical protein ACLP9L_14170 [Thermoguttaceae bacterium]
MPQTTLHRRMKRLESLGCILIKPDTHFSVITIVNWAIYQRKRSDCGHPTGHPTGAQRTGNGRATDTFKNGENGETGNIGTGRRARAEFLVSWNKETARKTFELANAVYAKLGGAVVNAGNRFNDRRAVLSACFAVVAETLPDTWLWEAVETARLKRPKNMARQLTVELKKAAARLNQDFSAILNAADGIIPAQVFAGDLKEKQTGE